MAPRGAQWRQPATTRTGDKVEVMDAVIAMQSARHGTTVNRINTSEHLGEGLAVKDAQRTYWSSLIVLAITFLLFIGVIASRRRIKAGIESDVGSSPVEGSSAASAIGSLLVGNTSAEIGDAVFLNDVRLQAGPKPDLFVVSGARGVRMLVSWEAAKKFQVVPSKVDLKGTIRRLPALEVLRKGWGLSKGQALFFGTQHVYIAADYVKEQRRKATDE